MSHYHAIAHRIGSAQALELASQLASWHDRMVAHERLLARSGQTSCDEDCPHAESVDLWNLARETYGEAAERLTFLKATAEAVRAGQHVAQPVKANRAAAG
ncbi:MAG TPA: hypothetical protein VIL35_03140 [Vicinamibacterales bacterium]